MKTRAMWLVLVLLLTLASPFDGLAQESGWTFQGTGEFGYMFPTRDLGKNVTDAQELQVLQATSKMDSSPFFGAGFEATTPDGRTAIRGMVRQTLGGGTTGSVVICGAFKEGEGICIPQLAKTTVTAFSGEVVFVQGQPGDALRQNFVAGLGLRSYQFVTDECQVDLQNPDLKTVCELVQGIYEAPAAVQPFFNFGFGFSFTAGPITAQARVMDTIGPYSGGGGNATGDYQNDLSISGGLSLRIR